MIGVSVSFALTCFGLAAIFYYFKRNQRQAAGAIGNVPQRFEDQPGVDNIDPHIRDENSPLLNSAREVSQDAKYLNVKGSKGKNSMA